MKCILQEMYFTRNASRHNFTLRDSRIYSSYNNYIEDDKGTKKQISMKCEFCMNFKLINENNIKNRNSTNYWVTIVFGFTSGGCMIG